MAFVVVMWSAIPERGHVKQAQEALISMTNTPFDPLPARPISAKRFSYNHLTPDERAQAGAEIYDQQYPIANLTMKQVEAVVGVSAADINRHRYTRRPKRKPFRLAKAIAQATPDDVANAHAVLGTDNIFAKLFEAI